MEFTYKATFSHEDYSHSEYIIPKYDGHWLTNSCEGILFFVTEDGLYIEHYLRNFLLRIVCEGKTLRSLDSLEMEVAKSMNALANVGDNFEMNIFDGENIKGVLKVEAVPFPVISKEKTIEEYALVDCDLVNIQTNGKDWLEEGEECSLGWYFTDTIALTNTALSRAIATKYKELINLRVKHELCADSACTSLTFEVTNMDIVKPILEEFFSCKVTKPIKATKTFYVGDKTWHEYSTLLYDVV